MLPNRPPYRVQARRLRRRGWLAWSDHSLAGGLDLACCARPGGRARAGLARRRGGWCLSVASVGEGESLWERA